MSIKQTTSAGSVAAGQALGVFVGGRSSRMGGAPKGLLHMPGSDEPLVAHALRAGAQAGYTSCWLVGDLAVYDALTAELECAPFQGRVADAPAAVGPLGGLRALLTTAAEHEQSHVTVIACDMPYVTSALLAELRRHSSTAPVLAARRDAEAPWEPMLARYQPAAVLPVLDATLAAGARSFQALFKRLEVARFEADGVLAALKDWDTPRDVRA